MNTFWQDLIYAIRKLRKQPGFAVASLLTLALGIGMNTAIFSIVNALLLRPYPAPNAERLVVVSSTVDREKLERRSVSYQDYLDWRDQNSVLENLAVQSDMTFTWVRREGAVRLKGEVVSSDYFPLLGGIPGQGRIFRKDEERDGVCLAVVSYEFWKNQTGSDPNLVGKILLLNEQPVQVLGILPDGFYGLNNETEVWLPVSALTAFGSSNLLQHRGSRWLNAFGRLKAGVTMAQAHTEMQGLATRLQKDYPQTNQGYGVMLIPFMDELLGDTKSAALMLMGAVAFVLLIACANVANLILVQTAARRKELALRTALGASRVRMTKQLVTESVLLTTLGGLLGIVLAFWSLTLMERFSPVTLPRSIQTDIDSVVLIFTLGVCICTGMAIGLITALRLDGAGVQQALKDAAAHTTDTRHGKRLRSVLVASQIALAFMLLIGAALMIRSFHRLQSIPLGFKKERLLSQSLSMPPSKYSNEKGHEFRRLLLEKVQGIPSVTSVALSSDLPFGGSSSATYVTVDRAEPLTTIRIYRHSVSPEFFDTLGIAIRKGRPFNYQDRPNASLAVIISQKMAKRIWPNEEAIGKRIKMGRSESTSPWMTVVGVADDVRHRALVDDPLEDPDDPDLYLSMFQFEEADPVLLIRTANEPRPVESLVRSQLRQLDRDVPLFGTATMDELLGRETAGSRFNSFLMIVFGGVALALACIGLYGVMSNIVGQQTREIGIRIALGATRNNIFRLVLRQASIWTACGLLAGIGGATILSTLIASQLYGVSRNDPAVFASIAALMITVSLAATCMPAQRASRVDPIVALKYE